MTINCDPAIGYIVEAGQQGAYGCLTAAGRTDQCDDFVWMCFKVRMFKNLCAIMVRIRNIGQLQADSVFGKGICKNRNLIIQTVILLWHIDDIHQPSGRCGKADG